MSAFLPVLTPNLYADLKLGAAESRNCGIGIYLILPVSAGRTVLLILNEKKDLHWSLFIKGGIVRRYGQLESILPGFVTFRQSLALSLDARARKASRRVAGASTYSPDTR